MWTDNTETFFQELKDQFRKQSVKSSRYYLFWKFIAFLYIPITVVAWIFGSKGLLEEDSSKDSSNTTNIVLLVVGAGTLVLDKLKPQKYKLFYKTQKKISDVIIHRIDFQLSRPRVQRKSPEDLLRKIQIEMKMMNNIGSDTPTPNEEFNGNDIQPLEVAIVAEN